MKKDKTILELKTIEPVIENLKGLMKNKAKKAELEERLKIEFSRLKPGVKPDDLDVQLVYNRMANSYDIYIKSSV